MKSLSKRSWSNSGDKRSNLGIGQKAGFDFIFLSNSRPLFFIRPTISFWCSSSVGIKPIAPDLLALSSQTSPCLLVWLDGGNRSRKDVWTESGSWDRVVAFGCRALARCQSRVAAGRDGDPAGNRRSFDLQSKLRGKAFVNTWNCLKFLS